MTVKVRYRDPNGKTVYVQRQTTGIFMGIWFMLCKLIPFLDTREWFWRDYTDLSNHVYQIKYTLNQRASDIESLVAQLKEAEAFVKKEKAEISKSERATRGVSEPFYVDLEILSPIGLDIEEPKDLWKSVVNPHVYGEGKKGIGGNISRVRSVDNNDTRSQRSVFIPQEDVKSLGFDLNDLTDSLDADTLVPYVSSGSNKNRKGGGGNNKSSSNNNNKVNLNSPKRQKGESEEGYRARLDSVRSGDFDANSWSIF